MTTSNPAPTEAIDELSNFLSDHPDLAFSMLIGSRATGTAHDGSDSDIALHWSPELDRITALAETKTLRHKIATALQTAAAGFDLIDPRRANLAMRASVAEEELPLSGDDSPVWARFLVRIRRDLQDFFWEKQHAA